jgi:opacity protein-like surface antigen
MKKSFIFLLIMLIASVGVSIAADIQQGTVEVSGAASLSLNSFTLEDKNSGAEADLKFNHILADGTYYFLNNFGAGLLLGRIGAELDDIDLTAFLIGPQVKYSFPINEKVNLFATGSFGYNSIEIEDDDADGWFFSIGGGAKFFLTQSISIDGTLRYIWSTLEDDYGTEVDLTGISALFGLSVYF